MIISQAYNEGSTNQVIDWLHYYNAPWKRVNGKDIVKTCSISDSDGFNVLEEFEEINVVWFRRYGERLGYNNF